MSTNTKLNDVDSKDIADRLREQGNSYVSPIDLCVEMVQPLIAPQLQWNNFYEPPLKLTLRNSGDTVIIKGRWPHQRPTLFGGPLNGPYVFSHIHFHWESKVHEVNRHTINGKYKPLEMHALFYKSSYQSQAEAQEKEDGILVVVYFFKVKHQSSFKWMTDHLENVKTMKTTSQLPPAPLLSLMVPFTKDYLFYRGVLPCTCHHILWMVSRKELSITTEELLQFSTLQSELKEEMLKDIETEKTAQKTYLINPSTENHELLFPNIVYPPCQIIMRPDKITIEVGYRQENTKSNMADNALNMEPNVKTCSEELLQRSTFQEQCTSVSKSEVKSEFLTSDSEVKSVLQSSEISTNYRYICSECKMANSGLNVDFINSAHNRFPRKRWTLENIKKIKLLEKERSKYRIKAKQLDLEKKDIATARISLEKKSELLSIGKEVLDPELKRLLVKNESAEILPEDNLGVGNSSPNRSRSPINKSVLTSRPNSVSGNQNILESEKEILEANSNWSLNKGDGLPLKNETKGEGLPLKNENTRGHIRTREENEKKEKDESTRFKSKLPVKKFNPYRQQSKQSTLIQNKLQSEIGTLEMNNKSSNMKGGSPIKNETARGHDPIKEEKEKKENIESTKFKSKHSVRKFNPYKPHGLQSSLTPFFTPKQVLEKIPEIEENNIKITTQIPKFNKVIGNGAVTPHYQDLRGKGDHLPHGQERTQQKVMGRVISAGINYL